MIRRTRSSSSRCVPRGSFEGLPATNRVHISSGAQDSGRSRGCLVFLECIPGGGRCGPGVLPPIQHQVAFEPPTLGGRRAARRRPRPQHPASRAQLAGGRGEAAAARRPNLHQRARPEAVLHASHSRSAVELAGAHSNGSRGPRCSGAWRAECSPMHRDASGWLEGSQGEPLGPARNGDRQGPD